MSGDGRPETALVLGGGGVAGIAWITGLLAGLRDSGRDFSGADLMVGTSAGSTVAAQLGSGLSLDELYARQTEPHLQARELDPHVDLIAFGVGIMRVMKKARRARRAGEDVPHAEMRRAVGQFALKARTVPEADRRAVIAGRLPSPDWPDRAIKIVAVDCGDGGARVFDNNSGVSLIDAVTASCAVPGIWPPHTIGGRRYTDGGVRSSENADYASGASSILILSPLGDKSLFPSEAPLEATVQSFRAGGAAVAVVTPDEASQAAIGNNPLDPATRRPAAEAGRRQGQRLTLDWGR